MDKKNIDALAERLKAMLPHVLAEAVYPQQLTYADFIAMKLDEAGVQDLSLATVPPSKQLAATVLGRSGGKKGGPARAAKLSPERRSEIARTAANARWEGR